MRARTRSRVPVPKQDRILVQQCDRFWAPLTKDAPPPQQACFPVTKTGPQCILAKENETVFRPQNLSAPAPRGSIFLTRARRFLAEWPAVPPAQALTGRL